MLTLTAIPAAMEDDMFLTGLCFVVLALIVTLVNYAVLLDYVPTFREDEIASAFLVASIIPIILCVICIRFSNTNSQKTGYKLLQKTPTIKLTQVSVDRDPDHASDREYTYKFEDSEHAIYVVKSKDKIDLSGYIVKIPYDKSYGMYMHLFKGNKFIKDYEIEKTYYEK